MYARPNFRGKTAVLLLAFIFLIPTKLTPTFDSSTYTGHSFPENINFNPIVSNSLLNVFPHQWEFPFHINWLATSPPIEIYDHWLGLDLIDNPIPQENGLFGNSIDASEGFIVIGAPFNDISDVSLIPDSGEAFIFECKQTDTYRCTQVATLRSPNPVSGDLFGFSVGIFGDTVIVSATENGVLGDQTNNAGIVYVFERNQGGENTWELEASLRPSESANLDIFGYSIGIDQNLIVASAPWEDGGPGDPLPDAGAVYIFQRNQEMDDPWREIDILRASDAEYYDYFGSSVSINLNTIVVGAHAERGGAGDPIPGAGAAYVFQLSKGSDNKWEQGVILRASDAQIDDWFGMAVDIDGDIAVVGAPREDGGNSNYPMDSGAAYIFSRNKGGANHWSQVGILHAPEANSYDSFGSVLSINHDLIFIGAAGKDGVNNNFIRNSGAVYAYSYDLSGKTGWNLNQVITPFNLQEDNAFGTSVTSVGNYLFVGLPGNDGDPGNIVPQAGAVTVFELFNYIIYLPTIFNQ
jgi:hypothetical protein